VALEAQPHPHEHAEDGARQRVVPRQQIAKTIRKTQHPLAHGHPRQHLVDEAGGALRYASSAATRAEARSLQEKGTSRRTVEFFEGKALDLLSS
jgi:hypothetical protein